MQMSADESKPTWATADLPMHSFGSYRTSGTMTWDSADIAWNDANFRWDSPGNLAAFPTVVGGDLGGGVYEFGGVSSDNQDGLDPVAIPFSARTGKLIPYRGQRSRLGYIDILAEPTGGTLKLNLYVDDQAGAYKVVQIPLEMTGTDKKVRCRVKVGRIGEYHEIELVEETTNSLVIDQLVAYFKPVGPSRETHP